MSLKLVTIVGTRPEIIKLSRTLSEADRVFDHKLVHTGQNYDYELNQVFFDELEIRTPDHFLESAGATPAVTIANVIQKSDELLRKLNPDAVLFYGDTNSCLASISAKRLKIPIFHLEAGNRCFDQNVPEEINRKIVDHISDINMVHSESARRYLLNEGLLPEKIIKTGSPMLEVINFYKDKIGSSDVLKRLNLESGKYFLASLHREENVDAEESLVRILKAIDHLSLKHGVKTILSTHPRTQKRLEALTHYKVPESIVSIKPLGLIDYLNLQMKSLCVLSDSGTLTEEASILNFKGVMVRNTHERPEGMDRGTAVLAGTHNKEDLINAVEVTLKTQSMDTSIPEYSGADFSKQVVRVIQSYTHYINKNVWRKNV